jgi:hypothetical protein
MNPLSLIMIGLGLIMIYIGWKGSQHNVLAGLLGHGSAKSADAPSPSGKAPAGTTGKASQSAQNKGTVV